MKKAKAALMLCAVFQAGLAFGQVQARIQTNDTILELRATTQAPQVVTLSNTAGQVWQNRMAEKPIAFAVIGGKEVPLAWHFNSRESQRRAGQITFVYDCDSPRLRWRWIWSARTGFGPIEHSIEIQNLSEQEIWIPLQDSFAYDWKVDPSDHLTHLYVEKGADTPSPVGTHELQIKGGYRWTGFSSTYAHKHDDETREIIPWSLVEKGSEGGWYVGIEFSGRTRISLQRGGDALQGAAGLNPEPGPFRTRLAAHESFTTPTVLVGAFSGSTDEAGNGLRSWIAKVLGNPLTWASPQYPYTVNNSWGSGMAVDESMALRMIRDSAELGLEMFHIDAGWFRGVGDWYPNSQKFPRGLAPIADEAHKRGLKFGIWADWTQAGSGSEPGALNANDPKVRDWLVTELPPGWEPDAFKGQTTDIGYPPAKAWAQKQLEHMVRDFHLDMLEHDGYLVAQGCVQKDHPHAPPDPDKTEVYKDSGFYFARSSNSTDVSYRATRAYYDLYEQLRQNHPGLLLEVCNDGGRMVDFGSAAHADYFSITDTYDPLSNRRAFFDTSHVLPAPMLESYVEKWPTPQIENFRYMLRSGMMGWFTIMQDTTAWSEEQHRIARQEIEVYKSELRPFIRNAELYHISDRPDGVHWDGIEYFDPQRRRGVVYAFRGSVPEESAHAFKLAGVRPAARYRLTFHDHTSDDKTIMGQDLLGHGIEVKLPIPLSSELVFFEETTEKPSEQP